MDNQLPETTARTNLDELERVATTPVGRDNPSLFSIMSSATSALLRKSGLEEASSAITKSGALLVGGLSTLSLSGLVAQHIPIWKPIWFLVLLLAVASIQISLPSFKKSVSDTTATERLQLNMYGWGLDLLCIGVFFNPYSGYSALSALAFLWIANRMRREERYSFVNRRIKVKPTTRTATLAVALHINALLTIAVLFVAVLLSPIL